MNKIIGILSISVVIMGIVCAFLFFQLTSIQSQINELNNKNGELENQINQLENQILELENPFNIYKEIVILNQGSVDKYSTVNRDWWLIRKNNPGAIYIEKNSWIDFKESLESNPPMYNTLYVDENNKVIWHGILPMIYFEY